VCRNNYDDLVNEAWVDELIRRGVHYVWFTTFRPVGPDPAPELTLSSEQIIGVRRFAIKMRSNKPIAVVDAYWDSEGRALCPAAVGISHHISPWGDIEPCPIVQFARDNIQDNNADVFRTITESDFLESFRKTVASATRGCIVLEKPDMLSELLDHCGARDTTARASAMAELAAMRPCPSHHLPGSELPEEQWLYRFAKKYYFFGFGAYA